jgi:hypothetical protein
MLPMKMIVPPSSCPCMMALACWATWRGDQVEADDALVKTRRRRVGQGVGRATGVVHHHVQAAMTRLDLAEQGLQGFHLPHVGGDELGLGPARSRQGLRGLAAAHHHLAPAAKQRAMPAPMPLVPVTRTTLPL